MIVTEFCDFGDLRSKLSSFDDGDEFLWRARGRDIMLQVREQKVSNSILARACIT